MKTFVLFLLTPLLYAQQLTKKYIVDGQTKQPLSSVIIHDIHNYTLTNEDGYFFFHASGDTITIKLLGYKTLKITPEQLNREKDTLFLDPKPIELSEVVVGSNPEILSQVYRKALDNYPNEPFVEDFFLRCVLKLNGDFLKIEDIAGRVKRNKLLGLRI